MNLCLCITPTHHYLDQNDGWKPCIIQFLNPSVRDALDVRDTDTSDIITFSKRNVKPFEVNDQEKWSEESGNKPSEHDGNGIRSFLYGQEPEDEDEKNNNIEQKTLDEQSNKNRNNDNNTKKMPVNNILLMFIII